MKMDNWPHASLGELCEFIRGVTYELHEASPAPSEGCLPILRAGNIADSLDLQQDLVWVPSSRVSDDQLLRTGDIVMCMSSGSARVVGKSALVPYDWAGSAGAFCGILRPRSMVDAQWLAFWLRSAQFMQWRDSQARGANIQNLRFSQLSGIVLQTPAFQEQQRIVAKLGEQMAALDHAEKALAEQHAAASTLSTAVLQQAFNGSESARWPQVRLGEVAASNLTQVPPNEEFAKDLPYIGMEDIESQTGRIIARSAHSDIRSNTFAFDERHVLYGKLRPYLNKVALPESGGRCSTELIPLLPAAGLDRRYLAWFLRRPETVSAAMQEKTGSRMPRASMKNIGQLHIPLPPLSHQRQVVASLERISAELTSLQQHFADQRTDLAVLRSSLLNAAFSGEA